MSVEKKDINKEAIKNNLFEITRYDCNQIKDLFFKQ